MDAHLWRVSRGSLLLYLLVKVTLCTPERVNCFTGSPRWDSHASNSSWLKWEGMCHLQELHYWFINVGVSILKHYKKAPFPAKWGRSFLTLLGASLDSTTILLNPLLPLILLHPCGWSPKNKNLHKQISFYFIFLLYSIAANFRTLIFFYWLFLFYLFNAHLDAFPVFFFQLVVTFV